MSKRDDHLLVHDMLESAKKILEYVKGLSFDEFIEDDKTIDAVVRNFEIIGEASSRVSLEMQNAHTEIPWLRLKGYRNRLIHEYFGVDLQIVWDIISDDLEELISALNQALIKNN